MKREWPIHLPTVDRDALGPERSEQLIRVIRALEKDAEAGERLAQEVCKIVDSDGAQWRARITEAVIEHDKVVRPWSALANTVTFGNVEVKEEDFAPEAVRRMVSEKELKEIEEIRAFMKQRARMKSFTVGHGDFIQMCTVCDADDRGTPHRSWCPLYVKQ